MSKWADSFATRLKHKTHDKNIRKTVIRLVTNACSPDYLSQGPRHSRSIKQQGDHSASAQLLP